MAYSIHSTILALCGLFLLVKGQQMVIQEVRLVGGNVTAGRVEILVSGNTSWGTVCDHMWDDQDAKVVCRTLGLTGGLALSNTTYGPGSGPIWIHLPYCAGNETHLRDCNFDRLFNFSPDHCSHNEDASVICQSQGTTAATASPTTPTPGTTQSGQRLVIQEVRLVGGNVTSGRVEVLVSGNTSWGTVCDDLWGDQDATVVCRTLGLTGGLALSSAAYGPGSGPIWIHELHCAGSEIHLRNCYFFYSPGACNHNEDAGVICQPQDTTAATASPTTPTPGTTQTATVTFASSTAVTTPVATHSTSTAMTTDITTYIPTTLTTSPTTQTTSAIKATTSEGTQRMCGLDGGIWPETPAGHTVDIACPDGYPPGQNRSRTCSVDGKWLSSNTSACVMQKISQLEDVARQLLNGTGNATTAEVSQLLSSATANASVLQTGDLVTTVSVMRILAAVSDNNGSEAPSRHVLQNVVQSADNLLQADDVWVDQTESAFGLMEALDVLAKSVSKGLNSSESPPVITKKIVIVVGSSDLEQTSIAFPKPSNDSTAEHFPDWLLSSKSSVFLEKGSFPSDVRNVGYSVAMYNNISSIFSRSVQSRLLDSGPSTQPEVSALVVNSPIIALSVSVSRPLLREVRLTFEHLTTNYSETFCRYLDFKASAAGRWSGEGCRRVDEQSNSSVTVCSCNHLTSFALLMSPYRPTGLVVVEVLTIFTIFGCTVSIIFLVITLFVYAICWQNLTKDRHSISTTRTKILVNLCVILVVAYVIFLAGVNRTHDKAGCRAVAVILHYVWLVAFFLMLSEGVHIFISIIIVFPQKSIFKWLMVGSYGVPVMIVIISLGATKLEGYGGPHSCWLSLDKGVLWAFVGPALATLLANFIFVALVVRTLMMSKTMMSKSKRDQTKAIVKAICIMSPVLGLTWVFGVLGVNEETVAFQVLFVIFNSMQGFLIFIFHCLLAKPVRDALQRKTRKYSLSRFHHSSTGTQSTSAGHTKKLTNQESVSENYNARAVMVVNPLVTANDYTDLPANEEANGQGQAVAAFVNFTFSADDNNPKSVMPISTNASMNNTVSESSSSTTEAPTP